MSRLRAMLMRDLQVFFRSRWKWLEFFYFPVTSIFIWGFFALWTGEFASEAGRIALILNLFWSYAYVVQSAANLTISEDSWHCEGHHLFVAGIGKWGYIGSRILFSLVIISPICLLSMILITQFLFVDISQIAIPLIPLSALVAFISASMAILIAGLIFALGREYNWLSWSSNQLFIVLSFPLFPLEMLPTPIQSIAELMPYGAFFESIKALLLGKQWVSNAIFSLASGLAYLGVALLVYSIGFDLSRKTGKFARMF